MIVLDTNVISEPLRPSPDAAVAQWLDKQHPDTLFITTLTVAELRAGIAALAPGRRRTVLNERIEDTVLPAFADRILPFDSAAAHSWALIQTKARAEGRPLPVMDSLIAAIAHSRGYALATRNVKDFTEVDIKILNPWRV